MPPNDAIKWSHTSMIAGDQVSIQVTDAPEGTVKIEIYVDGDLRLSRTVNVPGGTTYDVPSGDQGKPFEIRVTSGSATDNSTGTIA